MPSTARSQSDIEAESAGPPSQVMHLHPVARSVTSWPDAGSSTSFVGMRSDDRAAWRHDELVTHRIRLRRGAVLVHRGDRFAGLHGVLSGSCKSTISACGGQEQVADYHIAGDVLGAEAILSGVHNSTVTALEDSEFGLMPLARVHALARRNERFQQHLCALFSREIGRDRTVMLMLGTMRADQRLATFLLDLADRYGARGYSSSEIVLRMTREEIGGYLGVTLETVSRVLSRMHREGVVAVSGRVVKLLDRPRLRTLARGLEPG